MPPQASEYAATAGPLLNAAVRSLTKFFEQNLNGHFVAMAELA